MKRNGRSVRLFSIIALLAIAALLYALLQANRSPKKKQVTWYPYEVSNVRYVPPRRPVHRLHPPAPPIEPRLWQPRPPSSYTTIGFLANEDGTRPLLGRRSHTRRYRWYYTTTNDTASNISSLRLPLTSVTENKKCTEEIGCAELMDGDMVTVPGAMQPMRVHLYETHFG